MLRREAYQYLDFKGWELWFSMMKLSDDSLLLPFGALISSGWEFWFFIKNSSKAVPCLFPCGPLLSIPCSGGWDSFFQSPVGHWQCLFRNSWRWHFLFTRVYQPCSFHSLYDMLIAMDRLIGSWYVNIFPDPLRFNEFWIQAAQDPILIWYIFYVNSAHDLPRFFLGPGFGTCLQCLAGLRGARCENSTHTHTHTHTYSMIYANQYHTMFKTLLYI